MHPCPLNVLKRADDVWKKLSDEQKTEELFIDCVNIAKVSLQSTRGNLVRRNLLDSDIIDVKFSNERGLEVKTLLHLLDLRLVHHALHLTYNMHTADWNTRALTQALHLLRHRALDYDEVHHVRLAYTTYEHMDMKGIVTDRKVLLRALKMCGRVIAPLKLVHKVKHSKSQYVEKGRIQLDEFFGLILWCDLYSEYSHDASGTDPVKDDYLFKLADFPAMLSHHDERLTQQLNVRYLKEERTFEVEQFGSRGIFKDPTVNVDFRINQVKFNNKKFQGLKDQIDQSQQRVHSAHAGSVRPRPISTPDLDKYRKNLDHCEHSTPTSVRLNLWGRQHLVTPIDATSNLHRTQVHKETRVKTPSVITPSDLQEVRTKMAELLFDISTLETRCQVQVESEMMFYIPRHLQKLSCQESDTGSETDKLEHGNLDIRMPHSTKENRNSRFPTN